MKTRAAELRDRHRKILAWSLGVAIVVHLAIFFLTPEFEAVPLGGSSADSQAGDSAAGALALVDVHFGPPAISAPDGSTWWEPPERRLEARRGIPLPALCAGLAREGGTRRYGRVRLRVTDTGRADVIRLAESSGDHCADQVLTQVAGSLWYEWLPSERFPAPVELVQPVTVSIRPLADGL